MSTQTIATESGEDVRAQVTSVIEAIEAKTEQLVVSADLRARVARLVRLGGVEPMTTAVETAPEAYGPPMVVAWCEARAFAAADRLRALVALARERGASWEDLADVLSVSPFMAELRYG